MCGFIGLIRKNQRPSPHSAVKQYLPDFYRPLLKNRGPDDFRFFHSPCGKVEFYFYRLSIIDLDHGFQPSYSSSRKIVSVFNGEIYNYQELRQQLMTLGIQLKTNGDAEVIPNLYEIYGESFVEKLRGMFSILIWDGEKVLAYRDRMGIKPLYYYDSANTVFFSSEVKPLLRLAPEIKNSVNYAAVEDYLNYGYSLAPHNIFTDVHTVEPATFIRIQNQQITSKKYWQINQVEQLIISEPEALDLVDKKLNEVCALHMQADVPACIFLSGGFDSGILAAKAARTHPQTKAYTLRFPEKKVDESAVARDIAKMHNLEHVVYDVSSENLMNLLTTSLWQIEAPFADSGILANMFISQKVRADGIKVALCGAGGDEIFAGYSYHAPTDLEQKLMQFGDLPYYFAQLLPGQNGGKLKRAAAFSANPLFHYIAKTRVFNNFDHHHWNKDLKVQYFNQFAKWPFSARLVADLQTYVPDNLMLLLDRTTMAHSVEGRVPLLDHELVELMLSLPNDIRLPNNERKGFLKKLGKNILPQSMYSLPKLGFNSPVEQWMQGPLQNTVNSVLEINRIKHRDYFMIFEKRKIQLNDLNFHQRWTLLQLELFYRLFIDQDCPSAAPSLEELL